MPQKQKDVDSDLPGVADVMRETEQVIRQCFKQFQIDEVTLSFNGGKDCTVLLDLTIEILKDIYKRNDVAKDLKVLYIRTQGPFREIEEFVEHVKTHYGIQLTVLEGEIRIALQRILEQDKSIKACLMGTRRTDPYSEDLKFFQKTDPNWPPLIRVSPILNWSYRQIWSYILERRVPYCCLYDKGYTSIGSVHNTLQNPSLSYTDPCGQTQYHPAWMLSDGALERAGRISHTKPAVNGHSNGHLVINADSNAK